MTMTDPVLQAVADQEMLQATAETAALKRDIACRPGSLDLLYRIREALGFNRYYGLSHLAGDAKRLRTDALALAQEVIREYENLEDRAPTSHECIQCTMGAGPHKRTCAYHQAKAIMGRERC